MTRAGIREVAALAQVSIGTVSHYLNHPDVVSQSKKERIRSAIALLGFVPNGAGRQLRSGESSTIAFIAPDFADPFFAELAEGIERRASDLGLSVLVASSQGNVEREDSYLRLFEESHVRGLLVASDADIEERLERLRVRGIRSVLVGRSAVSDLQASLAVNDIHGGRLAAEHLLQTGRRRIAFIGGPFGAAPVSSRLEGASMAADRCRAISLEVMSVIDNSVEEGRRVGDQISRRAPALRPDSVLAASDSLALGVVQRLAQNGIAVPEEIAVVGYGDTELRELSTIPLTSIGVPSDYFGAAAVDLLVTMAASSGPGLHSLLEPHLVARRSSHAALRHR